MLTVLALNAFGGGWYGMAGAEGIPLEWLQGSPFQSYFLPSLILFVVVVWLAVQLVIIGYVSWMQPATAAAGLLALALARSPRADEDQR
jgi:hypothetical protein